MRRQEIEDRAADYVERLLRQLPRRIALALGRSLGRILGDLDRRHVGIAVENLRHALPHWDHSRRLRTGREVYAHFAQVLFDLLWLRGRSPEEVLGLVEVEGREHVEAALRGGRPIVFVTAHIGNWELHGLAHGLAFGPIGVIARPLDNPGLDRRMNELRTMGGNRVFYKQHAVGHVLRALREGMSVAIVIDQNVQEKDGIFVDFFGRPAATTTLAAALAVKTGCPLVPGHAELRRNGRYRLIYQPALAWSPSGDRQADIARLTQELTRIIEGWVREVPEQWLWIHRRWKTQPGGGRSEKALGGPAANQEPQTQGAAEGIRLGPRDSRGAGQAAGDSRGPGLTAEARRILIRAPNWLGDVVLSLAAVRDLRRNFPQARVEVLARPSVAGLYHAVGEIDAVRETSGFRADAEALHGAFDVAILLPNSFASALQVFLADIPERWGYATDGRGMLLTRRPRVPAGVWGVSQVYYYRAMLAGVGLEVAASPDVSLRCPEEWSRHGAELLEADAHAAAGAENRRPAAGACPEARAERWVGLSPGAFFGSAKRWIPERYAALGDLLSRQTGACIAIVGGAAERALGEAIAARMRSPANVLSGRTSLPELAGVLSRLSLLVTNDSGSMHLAAALGTPVVALFGPTDWTETAPVGARHRLLREPVYCSPCKLRECPIDHRCMRRLTVDRVLEEARAALAEA